MKLKQLLLSASAALLLAGSASAAPTVLHIVGSTAFRGSAHAAIIAYINANGVGGKTYGAYVNSSANSTAADIYGASVGQFQDAPTFAASTIVVKTFWTGSASGLVDLVTNTTTQNTFLQDTATLAEMDLGSSATNIGTNVTANAGTLESEHVAPEASFSDSFYTSVATAVSTAPTFSATVGTAPTTATNGATLANLINNAPVQDAGTGDDSANTTVGVVPFAWWVGKSTTLPSVSNITQEAASALTQGPIPVSFLSGNTADQNSFFYLIGRNEDSGTRIAAYAETQQGFGGAAVQFAPTYTGTTTTDGTQVIGGANATVASLALFPANQLYKESAINWNSVGHSGYYSGGDVKNTLLSSNPGTEPVTSGKPFLTAGHTYGSSFLLGYLGWADGNGVSSLSANAGPGKYLSYNGVAPTVGNIQNGTYTFWSFEHLYYLTSGTNAVNASQQPIADGIADLVYSTYAPTNSAGTTANSAGQAALSPPVSGILYNSSFLVNRGQEGAPLAKNY